mmetsp:Transcript_108138/g.186670  ORF Transcript_108138/g.186670 Transcript_108138/m.186670 type:complete len:286 (+) Transcript_108138:1135-1992(+)
MWPTISPAHHSSSIQTLTRVPIARGGRDLSAAALRPRRSRPGRRSTASTGEVSRLGRRSGRWGSSPGDTGSRGRFGEGDGSEGEDCTAEDSVVIRSTWAGSRGAGCAVEDCAGEGRVGEDWVEPTDGSAVMAEPGSDLQGCVWTCAGRAGGPGSWRPWSQTSHLTACGRLMYVHQRQPHSVSPSRASTSREHGEAREHGAGFRSDSRSGRLSTSELGLLSSTFNRTGGMRAGVPARVQRGLCSPQCTCWQPREQYLTAWQAPQRSHDGGRRPHSTLAHFESSAGL